MRANNEIKGVRRRRKLTPEEAERYRKLREAAEAEMDEVRAERRGLKEPTGPDDLEDLLELRRIFRALKAERERQGLSLADLRDRTGISRSRLSKLETAEEINPTLNTVLRYARALGKKVAVSLLDQQPAQAGSK